MMITRQVFLDLSVSQYSLVGGPFCINLSRMDPLVKPPPATLPTLIYHQPSTIYHQPGPGGEVEAALSLPSTINQDLVERWSKN